ncbi:MoaF N-terminal domain-containing protein [Thermodesulfobacteriota bacterium]
MLNEPMHRFKYTNLTKEQIGKQLTRNAKVPECVSEFSNILAGKSLKIITKDGPVLEYKFEDKNKLTLSEDGGIKVKSGYGALTLNQMVLFSHMIPEKQRGFNVYVDLDTNLVTVIEVWLSSGLKGTTMGRTEYTIDNREVQRQIYFGYIDEGKETPEELHHHTNRLEGKGLYWKQDTGHEILEYFTSVVSTNFVELTRQVDDLGYCAPAAYVLINDNMFIHDMTECEFAGIFTSYVADLYSETQAGVRLGFNEDDELEYYMFMGTGKVVGQIAYLEPFDEHGKSGSIMGAPKAKPGQEAPPPQKGQRYAYRPVRDFKYMSDEEVHEAALKSTTAFGGRIDAPQMMGSNNSPFSDILVGKKFTLRYDHGGPVRHYEILSMDKLKYREDGESKWHEEDCRCYEADDNLAWFAHILTDSKPRACAMVALDLTNGLTTCIHSQMGTKYFGNETSYYAMFGVAEMEGIVAPQYVRHELSNELVGHAYSWSYSDQMTSMHFYSSPHSMTWTIFTGDQTMGAQWASPCLFVKLREGVYIFCQNEEACNGAEMCELINTKISHDCGFNFSGNARGVNLGLTGAIGRHIGSMDVKKYFGPKARKGV